MFAIAIPQFVREGFDPQSLRTFVQRAEDLGYESAWTQEQVLGSMPNLGSAETMTFAAACTNTIRLGCAVFVSPLHNPVHLAKTITTIDQLSGGRVEAGIAIGGRRMFSAFAVDPVTLVARFNEGLTVMKALWSESRVDFEGRFWQLHGAAMEPKPVQQPHPPIWFGGSHPDALRRAAKQADGFFGAGSQTTEQFAQQVPIIRRALDELDRDRSTFRIAKRIYIAVDDDADRARQRMAAALHDLYGYFGAPDLSAVAVNGTPQECARGVRAVVDAGADLVLL